MRQKLGFEQAWTFVVLFALVLLGCGLTPSGSSDVDDTGLGVGAAFTVP